MITEYELIKMAKRARKAYRVVDEMSNQKTRTWSTITGSEVDVFALLASDVERLVEECRRALAASRIDRAFPPAF